MSTGGKGGSIYDQSAKALTGAGTALQKAGTMYGSPGLSGINPMLSANPAAISSGISKYMNPFTSQVIGNTTKDIQNLTDIQQNVNGANASAVGAFGGSRQGIVEGLTNSEAQKNIGDISSQLRMQGFDTAAGLSAQDIANKIANNQFNAGQGNNFAIAKSSDQLARAAGLGGVAQGAQSLGTTGMDIGNSITQQQQQQGGLQQALIQAIMGGASGQFAGMVQKPQDMLSMIIQSLGLNPLAGAKTTTGTTTPGLFDWLSLIGQTAGSIYGGGKTA